MFSYITIYYLVSKILCNFILQSESGKILLKSGVGGLIPSSLTYSVPNIWIELLFNLDLI